MIRRHQPAHFLGGWPSRNAAPAPAGPAGRRRGELADTAWSRAATHTYVAALPGDCPWPGRSSAPTATGDTQIPSKRRHNGECSRAEDRDTARGDSTPREAASLVPLRTGSSGSGQWFPELGHGGASDNRLRIVAERTGEHLTGTDCPKGQIQRRSSAASLRDTNVATSLQSRRGKAVPRRSCSHRSSSMTRKQRVHADRL